VRTISCRPWPTAASLIVRLLRSVAYSNCQLHRQMLRKRQTTPSKFIGTQRISSSKEEGEISIGNIATDSVYRILSWEADSCSDGQEVSANFMDPEGLLPCSKEHTTGTYFTTSQWITLSSILLLVLSSYLCLGPSMSRFHKWSFPFRFSNNNFVRISHFSRVSYIIYFCTIIK
jgi:hypothetical protein